MRQCGLCVVQECVSVCECVSMECTCIGVSVLYVRAVVGFCFFWGEYQSAE